MEYKEKPSLEKEVERTYAQLKKAEKAKEIKEIERHISEAKKRRDEGEIARLETAKAILSECEPEEIDAAKKSAGEVNT